MVKNEIAEFDENVIRDRIYSIRGFQVMLDFDLAVFYDVKVKRLNEQVKRNNQRFPVNFCFRLTEIELNILRSQFATAIYNDPTIRSQIAAAKKGGRTNCPFAFTQEGVAMLSAVLKSNIAVEISVKIMSAFISMRKFIQSNAQVFGRLENVEVKLLDHDQKIDKLFNALENQELKPMQGIFYENQVFDAYKFVSDLFRRAKKSILIIDNYIDDSVLVHLTKVSKCVKVKILTKVISDQLALDIKKFNSQYFPIEVIVFAHAHDRFIIIDNKDVYHLGASLKDLGKKWFAFSKIDKSDLELLSKLEKY